MCFMAMSVTDSSEGFLSVLFMCSMTVFITSCNYDFFYFHKGVLVRSGNIFFLNFAYVPC